MGAESDAIAIAAAAAVAPLIFGLGAVGEIGAKQPSAMLAAAAEQTQMAGLVVIGKAVNVPIACGAASMKAVGWSLRGGSEPLHSRSGQRVLIGLTEHYVIGLVLKMLVAEQRAAGNEVSVTSRAH